MAPFFHQFILAFVPIFVAVDVFGTLPLYMGLTYGMEETARRRTVRQSILTALLVAVGFILLGREVFDILGITEADFMVAGGTLLFIIATTELVSGGAAARQVEGSLGVVPLGTPLLVGPAVLTAALILSRQFGLLITLAAVVANVVLAGAVLSSAGVITRAVGEAGSKALSKVSCLFLAAYAVMMVRRGLWEFLANLK